ncbi:MAG TPA: Mut7-C RNAse domain-containing protein [Azospirillaceae bacterium]|nr:Mut7-C RNAse domain-containing protein [Azospirillaceae bacterium]
MIRRAAGGVETGMDDGAWRQDGMRSAGTARLLCDAMLAGLARWLRAAGHDTALAGEGRPDAEVLARGRAEGRLLLTRDRRLAEETPGGDVLLLGSDDLDAQAAELVRRLGLDWTHNPFSRCMLDNTPLRPAGPADLAAIPEAARTLPGPFRSCPCCGRVFWPGSHVRRMEARLRGWKGGTPAVR